MDDVHELAADRTLWWYASLVHDDNNNRCTYNAHIDDDDRLQKHNHYIYNTVT